MRRSVCFLAALFFIGSHTSAWPQDKTPQSPRKVPDGVYAVLRESLKEKDVLPLKEGEALVVNNFRYSVISRIPVNYSNYTLYPR